MATGSKIKVVADRDIPFLKGALEPFAKVVYLPGKAIGRSDLLDADALIVRTRTCCDEQLLKGTSVKFIASATIGYDHIDTDYCKAAGIRWTNAPGCNSSSVEQYILSALLSLSDKMNFELSNRTIGIVGVGHVGSKVERSCRSLGMNVLLNDPPRARQEGQEGFVSLDEVCRKAEIISLHVPLNTAGPDKTLYLADAGFFDKLEKKPILLNSSRGKVLSGKALKIALSKGTVSAAVLDVWEAEPDIDPDLLDMVNIASPHIAGYSIDGKANGTGMSIRALSRQFGLGIDDWQPNELPEPPQPEILIDATGMETEDLVREVGLTAYAIMRDDGDLRKNPGNFEKLRAEYPVRREPPAIRVKLINDGSKAGPILEKLGFQVLGDYCM